MTLQTIKSIDGKDEYVLLPVNVYMALQEEIEDELAGLEAAAERGDEYVPFVLEDYVDNPVALARMKEHLTQKELAERLGVTQAYISKVERQDKVTPQLLARVKTAIQNFQACVAKESLPELSINELLGDEPIQESEG